MRNNMRSRVVSLLSMATISLLALTPLLARSDAPTPDARTEDQDHGKRFKDPCRHAASLGGQALGLRRKCPTLTAGSGVAGGDFNGDGVADLAIGAPGEDLAGLTRFDTIADAGVVHIIYGTASQGLVASGLTVPTNQVLHQSTLPLQFQAERAETGDQFGQTVVAGDFNGDGVADLAVGVTGETVTSSTGRGAVQIFVGVAGQGLNLSPSVFFGPAVFAPVANPTVLFAATSMTWGRFNDDQFGDLVVASEYQTTDPALGTVRKGVVTFLFGSSSGLTTAGKVQFETDVQTAEPVQQPLLPLILAAGDFNHDAISDLAVGSPRFNFFQGGVHVVFGTTTGPTLTGQQFWDPTVTPNLGGTISSFEGFGSALAVGDFNGDTFDDLAIGVPDRDVSGTQSAGAVVVIHGSLVGLDAPASGPLRSQAFTQASTATWGSLGTNDRFGAALAAGDFNGDGAEDLAIGVPNDNFSIIADAGAVNVVYGSASAGLSVTVGGHSPQRFTQNSISAVEDTGERVSNDHFGSALSSWNYGRSAHKDLSIGVPFEDIGSLEDAGIVQVLYGSASNGLTAIGNQVWSQGAGGIGQTAEAGDHFGQSVY